MTISKEDDVAIWNLASKLRMKLGFTAPELQEEKIAIALERACVEQCAG
jgi:hypothetical protein